MSGPDFSDLRPVSKAGTFDPLLVQARSVGGINNGTIYPVVPTQDPSVDDFREGATLLIYLEVGFPALQVDSNPDAVYVSGLRIKPWWLRSAVEFRTPGDPAQSGNPYGVMGGRTAISPAGSPYPSQIDAQVFGGWSIFAQPFNPSDQFDAANSNGLGNRNVWYPSPKRLDTVPSALGSAPLNTAITNTSDSILLDDVWLVPLPNPSASPWNAVPWNTSAPLLLGCPPNYRQNKIFTYPTFGRALGLSFEVTLAYLANNAPLVPVGVPVPPGPGGGVYPFVRVGYRSGVTHSIVQERVG